MEIFVISWITWETYTIEVESSATVAELKDAIEHLDGIPVEKLKLLYLGIHLNEKNLADYSMGDRSIISVVQERSGGGAKESEIRRPSPIISGRVILLSENILAMWSNERDKVLLDLMVEFTHFGAKDETGLKEEAWCDMATRINEETGMNVAVSLLKKRLDFYEREYRIVSDIRQQPTLSWDHQHNKLINKDDAWYQYEKENPEAELYRMRRVPHFDLLEILFSPANISPYYPISTPWIKNYMKSLKK